MNDRTYTVYKHTSPSGKVYIGITGIEPEKRWRKGWGYNRNIYFTNAIKKYGWDNIKHEIIATRLTKEEACKMEVELIAKYKSNQRNFGYNISNGGESIGKHSEESKMRISEALKGKYCGKNNPMYGKYREDNPLYGKPRSDEVKRKISEAKKGEGNSFYGKHHTEETKEKISKKLKGLKANGKHPNAKKVFCDKLIFSCIKECAEFYAIPVSTMKAWLNGRNKMQDKFVILELRYAKEEDIKNYPAYKNIK